MVAPDQNKSTYRATWAAGDYAKIAQGIQPIADHVVRCARIRLGERVLDIACGTGNATLAARARGAETTGLDLTPELLEMGRLRAAEEGVEGVVWQVGDAESLPFQNGSFDVVISSCGLMFAPDQPRAAAEVARVTRRGGRIAIQAWKRDGGVGRSSKLTSKYVPPKSSWPRGVEVSSASEPAWSVRNRERPRSARSRRRGDAGPMRVVAPKRNAQIGLMKLPSLCD